MRSFDVGPAVADMDSVLGGSSDGRQGGPEDLGCGFGPRLFIAEDERLDIAVDAKTRQDRAKVLSWLSHRVRDHREPIPVGAERAQERHRSRRATERGPFHLSSEEVDRDSAGAVIAGDLSEREWDENWTFWRDPSTDPSAVDSDEGVSMVNPRGWLFAHRGWVVTSIKRVGVPDPLDPSNL